MPKFCKTEEVGLKKSKTSETTSHTTSDSTHGGFNLNDKATDSKDVEVWEVRPTGRDKAKKKASPSSIPLESSVAAPLLIDWLVDKWKTSHRVCFPKRRKPRILI